MRKIIILSLLTVLYSCSVSKKEITGVYVFKNKLIIDSIIILENKTYERKIFLLKDKKHLLFYNKDIWVYENDVLTLKNFLNKTDNGLIISSNNDNAEVGYPIINTLLNPLKKLNGNIYFDIDDYNYFEKR